MDNIISRLNNSVPKPSGEIMGNDGLLHCATCGKAVETVVNHPFIAGKMVKVRCICDCKIKEMAAAEEKERRDDIERRKRICFAETNMKEWNFANDDGDNAKVTAAMRKYCDSFQTFRRDGTGIVLFGSVGTGKTYFAACVANELIESGYTVMMTNFARITNKIQGIFGEKNEYIDSLNRYDLLIIDDLGAERKSEYMQEMVFNIIDSRYRSGLPMIVTTNLTWKEITTPNEVGYARIYDRIIERCIPVQVTGASRRRKSMNENIRNERAKIGL